MNKLLSIGWPIFGLPTWNALLGFTPSNWQSSIVSQKALDKFICRSRVWQEQGGLWVGCLAKLGEEKVPCPWKPVLAHWVKSSALVTSFILLEGTHQKGQNSLGEFWSIWTHGPKHWEIQQDIHLASMPNEDKPNLMPQPSRWRPSGNLQHLLGLCVTQSGTLCWYHCETKKHIELYSPRIWHNCNHARHQQCQHCEMCIATDKGEGKAWQTCPIQQVMHADRSWTEAMLSV